jgi:PAS domain S-box-containing protein
MQQHECGALLSFLKEGIILFDTEQKIFFANPAALSILECDEAGVLGLTIQELLKDRLQNNTEEDNAELYTCVNALFHGVCDSVCFEKPTFSFRSCSGVQKPITISIGCGEYENGIVGILSFYDIGVEKELLDYRKNTKHVLSQLLPVLQKTATGDFSSRLDIPETETEFAELLSGVQLMIDDLVELSARKEAEQKSTLQNVKASETHLAQKVEETSQELEKATAHIEMIIENLTSGLVEYDSEFRVRRMNHAAEELLGIDREEVLGEKVLSGFKDQPEKEALAVVSYPVLAKEGKRIDKQMFGEGASVHEIVLSYPTRRELEVVTVPLIKKRTQDREGFIKVIRDITKEKEISRSKSDFINIAAHQLRTPLSAVKWVLRMILDGDMGSVPPSQRKLLDKGYETNEKMILMVNDLLNVARIEDDRFGYVFKEGDIMSAVADVVDELRIMAEKGGVDLMFDKPSNVEQFVFDFSKIQLACHNLIGNAIKYTATGGSVYVSLKQENKEIVVVVQDTGVGIPKAQMDKMFTKFFRAENAVRLQVGGSGLGLFIVKDIVARHKGSITVESIEGKGTTFTMKIPITHVVPVTEAPQVKKQPDLS